MSPLGRAPIGLPNDRFGAFCRDNHIAVAGAVGGPLAGLTFAAKDVFDIAGARTGYGHPDWLAGQAPAQQSAEAVTQLVSAGATLVGRTISDELCYSLSGENVHYGTPLNPRAPDRLPGGSSSGSASAVAGGLVDFSIGTDCGGSVRVPSAQCGIFGIRPTFGRVSLAGVHPFAPSFDCAGWMARDAELLTRVGRVLLRDNTPARPFRRLLLAEDAFERADEDARRALSPGVVRLSQHIGHTAGIAVAPDGLENWCDTFQVIQAAEIWSAFGKWVERTRPRLGSGVGERIAKAAAIGMADARRARKRRTTIMARIEVAIGPDDVVCLPTTPGPAPLRGVAVEEVEGTYRRSAMALLCIAGLGGLPQVTLPVGEVAGAPVGLSVIARRNRDVDLMALAGAVCPAVAAAE